MSSAPTQTPSTATPAPAKKELPQLLPLEDDDEFEEFPAEDWDKKDTYGETLGKEAGQGKGLDTLWDDNWDDDDVAEDFSVQLRGELAKQDQMQS